MVDDAEATGSQAPAMVGAVANAPIVDGDVFVDDPERYAVEGRIGVGGMGTVLAARGARLGRPVALKVVTLDREDLRRRFEREAQITARLQHPAIVPVYGAGKNRDGHPFYAMKQVSGEPLDKVVAKATTLAQRMALLPKVIAVTEAIAYAHAERVIHRDLKPANILVGAYGETVVIDWGLAKDLGAADDAADTLEPARPVAPSDDATAFGKVMGTPAYMPIEQARGTRVDERADVYALGAILYHLLAGASPFVRAGEGSVTWDNMLARVLSGPPAPLAELAPDVPPDLLAIVARAMATDAGARYPSAGALAEDLKRFQTGQLVGAHRYSRWQLVGRWVRRYRTAVAVAAVALVVLAVVSTVMIARIVHERDAAETARGEAETQKQVADTQRQRANEQRDSAEHLVGFMLSDLKPQLDRVGRLDIMRGVAKNVDDYYERLGPTTALDPRATDQRAVALRVLGDVLVDQGDSAAAIRAYRSAIATATATASTNGARDADIVVHAARAQIELGASLLDQGDLDGATAAADAGRVALEGLAARSPEAEIALATAYRRLGVVAFQRGHQEDAAAQLAHGVEHATAAGTSAPAKKELAKCLDRTSDVDSAHDDRAAAERDARAALALREQIIHDNPGDLEAVFGTGISWDKLYNLAVEAHQPAQATKAADTSLAIAESLVRREPENAQWNRSLADGYLRRAELADEAEHPDVAARAAGQAVALGENLVARSPHDAERLVNLADFLDKQGLYLGNAHQYDAAIAALHRALGLAEQASAIAPANTQYRATIATVHQYLGDTLKTRGDYAGAALEYRTRLAIDEELLRAAPDNASLQLNAASTRFWFGYMTAQAPAHRAEGVAAMVTGLGVLHALDAAKQLSPDMASALPDMDAELAKLQPK